MTPFEKEALKRHLDGIRTRIEHIDALDAHSLRRLADECRRLARRCRLEAQDDALADRFEATSFDIAMELDERTGAQWLSGESGQQQ